MKKISWKNEKRKLSELIPWEDNPRQINQKNAKRLIESIGEFGQVEMLAISPTNKLLNGHQRLKVLMDAYGPDYEISVRVSSRELTHKEQEKLTVYLHKGANGEWDFDTLANSFEVDELLEWGFEDWELGILPEDYINNDDFDDEEDFTDEDFYTSIRLRVSSMLKERFDNTWQELTGKDDSSKLIYVLDTLDGLKE